ncbi:MAG: hypothetical protein L0Z50_06550 [Verrucomicrobiales bacterium]|nr:hypothetical protein [Verrucomicrobiales bacterium]
MNRELEKILKAYDAAKQASGADEKKFLAFYESKLDEVLQRHPHLSRAALEGAIQRAYGRWLKAQNKPASLPPQA